MSLTDMQLSKWINRQRFLTSSNPTLPVFDSTNSKRDSVSWSKYQISCYFCRHTDCPLDWLYSIYERAALAPPPAADIHVAFALQVLASDTKLRHENLVASVSSNLWWSATERLMFFPIRSVHMPSTSDPVVVEMKKQEEKKWANRRATRNPINTIH